MTDTRVRFVEFERGEINLETGEFPMVLATDGEASDGDILSIEGAVFGGRAPLQLSHVNDPRDTLGTVSGFRRDLQSTPKKLRAKGKIELEGTGPSAEIRRDIAFMASRGHVSGISVRWEPIKYVPRTRLKPEHPAYVAETETDYRKRSGVFHEKWRVLEGSIVAIQADRESMIGRAEETTGAVSAFWRAMAEDAREREEVETAERAAPQPPVEPAPEPDPEPVAAAPEETAPEADEPREESIDELHARVLALEDKLAARSEGREQGSPSEQPTAVTVLREIMAESRKRHELLMADLRSYISAQKGSVSLDPGEIAGAARIKKRLEEARGV